MQRSQRQTNVIKAGEMMWVNWIAYKLSSEVLFAKVRF